MTDLLDRRSPHVAAQSCEMDHDYEDLRAAAARSKPVNENVPHAPDGPPGSMQRKGGPSSAILDAGWISLTRRSASAWPVTGHLVTSGNWLAYRQKKFASLPPPRAPSTSHKERWVRERR